MPEIPVKEGVEQSLGFQTGLDGQLSASPNRVEFFVLSPLPQRKLCKIPHPVRALLRKFKCIRFGIPQSLAPSTYGKLSQSERGPDEAGLVVLQRSPQRSRRGEEPMR